MAKTAKSSLAPDALLKSAQLNLDDFAKKLSVGKLAVEGSKPLRSAFVLTTGKWNVKVA